MELVDMRDLGSRAFSVRVRVPSGAPRRRGRHIVRGDFLAKVTSHPFCRGSFPNRTHFVGFRFGFDKPGQESIFKALVQQNSTSLLAGAVSLEPSVWFRQTLW